jgi:hypothetical protein
MPPFWFLLIASYPGVEQVVTMLSEPSQRLDVCARRRSREEHLVEPEQNLLRGRLSEA